MIGADAVLLITAILDDAQMHDFYQLARELELDVLVETHDEAEVERAMKINPRIIGVNNRNLKDFTISLEHTRRFALMCQRIRCLWQKVELQGMKMYVFCAIAE